MTPGQRQTLLHIARCPLFESQRIPESRCREVLLVQRNKPFASRQVPEPWRGNIDSPLLFVSSNPSIDPEDDSPMSRSSDNSLVNYFDAGFPSSFPRVLLRNGEPRTEPVRFWGSVRARAAELWGKPATEIRAGKDFAMTEIVHCKSLKEHGVRKAAPTCMHLHWERIVRASKANVIVVLGSIAARAFGLDIPLRTIRRVPALGNRWVITLPRPNAKGGKKSVSAHYNSRLKLKLIAKKLNASRID